MTMNRSKRIALLLTAVGVIILLNLTGMHWHVMEYLVPLSMVGLGYVGIRNGKKIGWVIASIGTFILAVKMSGILAILLGVLLIGYGFSLIKKKGYSEQSHL